MLTSRSTRQNAGLRDNAQIFASAALELDFGNVNVFATANTANGSYTISLPPVGPAAGSFVYVHATIANVKTVTLADRDNDAGLAVSLLLDTNNDDVLLYSTGVKWVTVYNGIA